jgi:hypothetical protein
MVTPPAAARAVDGPQGRAPTQSASGDDRDRATPAEAPRPHGAHARAELLRAILGAWSAFARRRRTVASRRRSCGPARASVGRLEGWVSPLSARMPNALQGRLPLRADSYHARAAAHTPQPPVRCQITRTSALSAIR